MATDVESKRKSAFDQSATLDINYDPGRRYPFVLSPSGFDKLSHLSDEEKQIGKRIIDRANPIKIEGVEQPPDHAAVQFINPFTILQSDPELMAAEIEYEETHYRLLVGFQMTPDDHLMKTTGKDGVKTLDPDLRRRHYLALLIVQKVAHEYKDEWTLRLMATNPGYVLTTEQFGLLGHPQSVVWDEEQSLLLEFAEGVMRRTLTDELHARAEAMWGRKQTLRYAKQITLYVGMLMFDYININDAERLGRLR